MGQGWWDLTRDNDAERNDIRSLALNQLKQDSLLATLPYERLLKTANGGERWILWNTSKGPMNTLVGIGHDITDRKKAEQQLLKKNKELEQHNKDMVDSITYASRIQEAILPDVQQIRNAFKDAFVLYQPKDVVSGDYYFFHRKKDKVFVAAVDCTGHGVPGALMSFIANSILKEVIIKKGLEEPSEILYALDEELFLSLNKQNSDGVTNDGMDVALGVFDLFKNTLTYSGAFRPMIMIRENEIIEFDPNRYPIGFYGDVKKEFVSRTIELQENDTFYFFTDGYCDQFGGELKKKFNRRRFKELLLSAQSMEMEEQESFLQYALLNWRQEEEQMDDILVMGVKI
jgi:serine phosphatase RsbU (regulator of sigma subunit)